MVGFDSLGARSPPHFIHKDRWRLQSCERKIQGCSSCSCFISDGQNVIDLLVDGCLFHGKHPYENSPK